MAAIELMHSKRQQQQFQKMEEMQQHHAAALAHMAEGNEQRSASRHRPISAVQVTAHAVCDDADDCI